MKNILAVIMVIVVGVALMPLVSNVNPDQEVIQYQNIGTVDGINYFKEETGSIHALHLKLEEYYTYNGGFTSHGIFTFEEEDLSMTTTADYNITHFEIHAWDPPNIVIRLYDEDTLNPLSTEIHLQYPDLMPTYSEGDVIDFAVWYGSDGATYTFTYTEEEPSLTGTVATLANILPLIYVIIIISGVVIYIKVGK